MPMKRFPKEILPLVVVLPSSIALLGLAVYAVLYWGFPRYYFGWYPLVPSFFILLSFAMSLWLIRYEQRNPQKMATAYLLLRGVKLLLAMALLFLYYVLIGKDMAAMVLSLFLFYIVYLLTETWLFYLFIKRRRQKVESDA